MRRCRLIDRPREKALTGEIEMKQSESKVRFGSLVLCVAASALALSACGKKDDTADTSADTAPAATTTTAAAADAGAAPAAAKVAADNVDTISGAKFASFTGDADKGKADFVTCTTCHAIEAGVNKIGPSLHGVVGRPAGSIAGYSYSAANKGSGITWSQEKLFQYLENPQRVVPGTKMSFPGWSDPQKRADVIAYLKANS
jgi:cytochrome c